MQVTNAIDMVRRVDELNLSESAGVAACLLSNAAGCELSNGSNGRKLQPSATGKIESRVIGALPMNRRH